MEFYLLKSTTCLLAFFIFYKLFLEKENMHTFKRFFLLGALLLSFTIPLITFYVPASITENINPNLTNEITGIEYSTYSIFIENLPTYLGIIYIIGVLIFSFRFIKNLRSILIKINKNPKLKLPNYIQVLLQDKVMPHTFFNYIFLNKSKLDAQEIPSEVLIHEQTHAQQKHSIDILFIEILQILFWFNPLIYFIKHSIKLNHEFLADEAVLSKGIAPNYYQNLLLVFSSNTQSPYLANSINYSLIKKRFTVMKTHTSKRKIWIRSLLLFPLVALALYSFSTKEEIDLQDSEPIDYTLQDGATKAQVKEYNSLAKKYNEMDQSQMRIKKSDIERLKYLYNLMSNKQRKSSQPFPNFPPPPPPPPVDKAPEPMVVKVGVNDKDPNAPPPPPKAPKAPKVKQEKTKIKKGKEKEKAKLKKEEDNLVMQRVKLENRNQEREERRLVLVEKRKEEQEKIKKLKHNEATNQRVALRLESNKERIQKRELLKLERKVVQEERKNEINNRKGEEQNKKLEIIKKDKIIKENI